MIDTDKIGDELHRTVKMVVDSGEALSIEDAKSIFSGYRLRISVGPDIADSGTLQATLLTAVNTAARCFLGGVDVIGCPDASLLIPWKKCRTLREAVIDLQGNLAKRDRRQMPEIVIGRANTASISGEFAVRATFHGWIGGVTPLEDDFRMDERQQFTPSGVFSGAIAVSEAFQFVRGHNPLAGKRSVGMSLWRPDTENWLTASDIGPHLEFLPARLWLIGLGHLGQAYLWTLGFLPYSDPGNVFLVLQDTDTLVTANVSTSPLTDTSLIGQKKTRAMAAWCEQRGFQTQINERLFGSNFKVGPDDPKIALCGVDNALARANLEDVGFANIIEAGLGRGGEEYLAFQIHSFPGRKKASHVWKNMDGAQDQNPTISDAPAYQDLAERGADRCGLTTLAGRSVGASFVGTVTSALVIAELLRAIIVGKRYDVIDGSLRTPESLKAFPNYITSSFMNSGFTMAA